MGKGESERCPKEFLDKKWIYVNTIVAKGGDYSLFLEYCEMKDQELPKELSGNGVWSSVHPIIVNANDNKNSFLEDWSEQDKISALDGAAYNNFGYSVSIDGDYTIIGALLDDDNGGDSGSA